MVSRHQNDQISDFKIDKSHWGQVIIECIEVLVY